MAPMAKISFQTIKPLLPFFKTDHNNNFIFKLSESVADGC